MNIFIQNNRKLNDIIGFIIQLVRIIRYTSLRIQIKSERLQLQWRTYHERARISPVTKPPEKFPKKKVPKLITCDYLMDTRSDELLFWRIHQRKNPPEHTRRACGPTHIPTTDHGCSSRVRFCSRDHNKCVCISIAFPFYVEEQLDRGSSYKDRSSNGRKTEHPLRITELVRNGPGNIPTLLTQILYLLLLLPLLLPLLLFLLTGPVLYSICLFSRDVDVQLSHQRYENRPGGSGVLRFRDFCNRSSRLHGPSMLASRFRPILWHFGSRTCECPRHEFSSQSDAQILYGCN